MHALDSIVATSREHLNTLVHKARNSHGLQCDLNHIDVSSITDFSWLFLGIAFQGDVSKWNVSNGTNFEGMFANTPFQGDISQWDVSKAEDMRSMFHCSAFNGDISEWDTSSAKYIAKMFENSAFAQDISMWEMPLNFEGLVFHTFYADHTCFLAKQSISPWTVHLHLAKDSIPENPEWARAFAEVLPLAQTMGLSFHEHARAIVAMHASMMAQPTSLACQREQISGVLFD